MKISVTLDDRHIAYCDRLAMLRQESADRCNRRGGNGGATMGREALDMNIKGARGECAAYLWLSQWFESVKWHTYRDGNLDDMPDLDDFIDVKTVVHDRPLLIVQPTAPRKWAYLLVNGLRHPNYAIEGWMWGDEVRDPKYIWDPRGGRGAFFVPARDLRHPDGIRTYMSGSCTPRRERHSIGR